MSVRLSGEACVFRGLMVGFLIVSECSMGGGE